MEQDLEGNLNRSVSGLTSRSTRTASSRVGPLIRSPGPSRITSTLPGLENDRSARPCRSAIREGRDKTHVSRVGRKSLDRWIRYVLAADSEHLRPPDDMWRRVVRRVVGGRGAGAPDRGG